MEIQIERGKSNYEKREQLANGIIINKKLPLTYLVGRRLTMILDAHFSHVFDVKLVLCV